MLKKLKFRYKILLIPGLVTILFAANFLLVILFSKSNEKVLVNVVNGYTPAWELSRDLLDILKEVQRGLQDAVVGQDEEQLRIAGDLRFEFINRIELERENPVLNETDTEHLKTIFNEYFDLASTTSARLLRGESGADLFMSMETMKKRYNDIKDRLESNIQRDKRNLSQSLEDVKNNNNNLIGWSAGFIAVMIITTFILSWLILQSIMSPLNTVIQLAERVADGDLTMEVADTDASDETGILLHTFEKMVGNLRDLTIQIKDGANALATAATEISTSVTQIAAGATETATAANETGTTVEEVRQTALDSNRKAKHVSDSAQKAVQISQSGEKAVAETLEGMRRIESQMESIAESIMRLSEHGQAIGGIIATVEDVTEQSNLLSVNASIEAAKAGEQGKGFAVVAQEVKSLAEQSQQATSKVRNILDDIQKATSSAVMVTEQGTKAVEAGVQQSSEAGDAIKRLANSVAEAAQATTQISVSSQEQLVGMDQIVSAMESIKQASTQNVAATKQVESAAHDLRELGQKLKDLIGRYKV